MMIRQKDLLQRKYWQLLAGLALLAVLWSGAAMAAPSAQAAGPAQGEWPPVGYVRVYQLNIRSGPETSFPVVNVVGRGQTLDLLGRNSNGNWLKVRLPNGQEGWAYTAYLQFRVPLAELPVIVGPQPDQATGYVNVPYMNLRGGPSLGYPIVGSLGRGAWLNLLGRNAESSWLQVSLPGRNPVWAYATYITTRYPISDLPVVSDEPQPGPQPTARVATFRLNFRTGPGLTFPITAMLPRHAQVTLLGRNTDGSWVMVDLGDGRVAWGYTSYLNTGYPIMNLPLIMTGS